MPKVTAVLAEGDPAQALLGVARERSADCIVVGSRGINSLSGRLLGSVPADVAYRSPCDVLIVHRRGCGRVTWLGGQAAPAGTGAERRSARVLNQ